MSKVTCTFTKHFNRGDEMNFYTLKSMKTGKYINNLFAHGHNAVFRGSNTNECYTWYSLEAVTLEKMRHDKCLIVKL